MNGVDLDNNGGQGTAGNHWSERIMLSDVMIGNSYGENLFSKMTLAAFEDSGWYQTNYSLANEFVFGKGQGCSFVTPNTSCYVGSTTSGIPPNVQGNFCTRLNYPICSPSNIFRGACTLDPSATCNIAIEVTNGAKYGGSCRVGSTDSLQPFEVVSNSSACMMANIQSNSSRKSMKSRFKQYIINADTKRKEAAKSNNTQIQLTATDLMSYCIQYSCDSSSNLSVLIQGTSTQCAAYGQPTTIPGYSGSIYCPDPKVICDPTYRNKFGGIDRYS